jgi:formate C-acetyltransferase
MGFDWWINEQESEILLQSGQIFASGFLLGEGLSISARHANGIYAELTTAALPIYDGESIYPAVPAAGSSQAAWHYYVSLAFNPELARQLVNDAVNPIQKQAFEKLFRFCTEFPSGGGYTHSIVNFGRVLNEGLYAYDQRIRRLLQNESDTDKRELFESLLVVVDGIDKHRMRVIEYLNSLQFCDPEKELNRNAILAAFKTGLPMRPADGFHEAMIATSFIYHIDGYDDLGRFDQFIWPYYSEDIKSGRIKRESALQMVTQLWKLVDRASGWNVALAGSTPDGDQAANDLTVVCLEAGTGRRRPNLALRLRKDTPDEIWDAALSCIRGGSGIPALYCEENYLKAIDLAQLNLPDEDKRNYAFGGCTELMIHGCSNVGSLDGDISVIKILSDFLADNLPDAGDFDDLYSKFKKKMVQEIYNLTQIICEGQEMRSKYHPQLIRTLLIDDCIDRGRNYYNGGARYNWSVVNVVGLSNAIDSLIATKHAVFTDAQLTAQEMVDALKSDFAGKDDLRTYLASQPKYGNDDEEVNDLTRELSAFIYKEFKRYAPWRGGKFICGTLMFTTYAWYGEPVGATPDGRRAGTPVADSAGPVQGRDRNGPTAMIHAVTSLSQVDAPGTLVVNIRIGAGMFDSVDGREKVKSLLKSYFEMGGMQIQVNVVDQKVLEDALAHPELHQDLVIRMGGYSEYWSNLTKELRVSVLERTEHALC